MNDEEEFSDASLEDTTEDSESLETGENPEDLYEAQLPKINEATGLPRRVGAAMSYKFVPKP